MRAKLALLSSLILAATACGESPDVSSPESVSENAVGQSDDGVLETLYDKVTWVFQCPAAPIPVPTPGRNQIVLTDAGPHRLIRERLFNVPVSIKGKICPPQRLNRDAIFIVDVSGSMSGNDPEVPVDPAVPDGPKTCGRYEAYKAVMANMPPGVGNFAVVTFGSDVERDSTQMWTTQADLEADLLTRGSPVAASVKDVFCENPGLTYYTPALERARELFATSRQAATKEIYFLTDGSPSDPVPSEAKATELKTVGVPIGGQQKLVTIATVMLGTTAPDFLRDKIASKDVSGQPIHANAANAADLARILDSMTDNRLAGSHVVHGGSSAPTPTTIDIMPHLNATTFEFTLPTTELAIDLAQSEYQVKFEYWDTHLNYFTVVGTLEWQDR